MEVYDLYLFIRGPLLSISFLIFFGGIIFRAIQFFAFTRRKIPLVYHKSNNNAERYGTVSAHERKLGVTIAVKNSLLGYHPVMAIATVFFHLVVFILPVFLLAHTVLIEESWNITLWSFPESLADKLTLFFLLLAAGFFFRRLLVPKVRALTTFSDYFVLLITVTPFLTGFFCYHQWFDYDTMLITHILSAEFMLISIPFTRLGHMVFFFLARFFIGSEYSLGKGTRAW